MNRLSELLKAAGGRSKYGNRKTEIDGQVFDSAKEANRYMELRLMERAGEIVGLECQVPFELVPRQTMTDGTVERAVAYVADFTYWQDGHFVVEDAKGKRTPEYIIKRKLMKKVHDIEIVEV